MINRRVRKRRKLTGLKTLQQLGIIVLTSMVVWMMLYGGSRLQASRIVPEPPTLGDQSAVLPESPVKLEVPVLNQEWNIEAVYETETGGMGLPEDENNVGWWARGSDLSRPGKMVLAGHIDRKEGGPGIFYEIDRLEVRDLILASDKHGNKHKYQVVESKIVETEEFPLTEVFGKSDDYWLMLVTCYGRFDPENQDYDQRLIVKALRV